MWYFTKTSMRSGRGDAVKDVEARYKRRLAPQTSMGAGQVTGQLRGVTRRWLREEGQAMIIVALGVIVVIGTLSSALFMQVAAQAPLTNKALDEKLAIQAANNALTAFQTRLAEDPRFPYQYCSNGYATLSLNASTTQGQWNCAQEPAPTDSGGTSLPTGFLPGFVNSFDPSCDTSPATTAGWSTLPGVTGAPSVQYEFVVDSAALKKPDSSGVVYVYATGRAGASGRYVCATVQTAFYIQAPTVGAEQSVPMPPSQGWTGVHFPSDSATLVTTVLDGASGAAGASDGTGTGGAGGQGAQLSATFVIPSGDMVTGYAGSPGQLGASGAGSNALGWGDGGDGGNRGGGGGAATVLCLQSSSPGSTPCLSSSPVCSGGSVSTNGPLGATYSGPLPCILAVAAGGGGGGEGVCIGSPAGAGGAGGLASFGGVGSTGSSGGLGVTGVVGFFGINLNATGGAGGQWSQPGQPSGSATPGAGGTTYDVTFLGFTLDGGANGVVANGTNGAPGVTIGLGGDSGGGGGGYDGGGSGATGGDCGGGAGGGGGASFVDTGLLLGGWGSVQWSPAPSGSGEAIVNVTPVPDENLETQTYQTCGQRRQVSIPSGATEAQVTLVGAGGGGASGTDWGPGGNGGNAGEVVATFQIPASTTAVTYELGCAGGPGTNNNSGGPNGGAGTGGSGGQGWSQGGQGGSGNYSGTFVLTGWCNWFSGCQGPYGGGGGGGGSSALLIGGTVVAVAGGGGGGGMPNCWLFGGPGSGGNAGSQGQPVAPGNSGGNADGGGSGGGGGSSQGGAGGSGNSGNNGNNGGSPGQPGQSADNGPGSSTGGGKGGSGNTDAGGGGGGGGGNNVSYTWGSAAGGGGGGYAGGGGGGSSSCNADGGGSGGGGGGSSWAGSEYLSGSPALESVPSWKPYGQGASGGPGCSSSNCASNAPSPSGNNNGYLEITWFVPVAQSASGSCQPGVSRTTVPSAGIWKVEIGGGGGAAGLALERGTSPVNGSGGPGALLTVRVFLPAGQDLEAVVGCNGFSGNGGPGFSNGADGGCSGSGCSPQGGGGGGSSALCLEGPDAPSGPAGCSPSTQACTTTLVPLQKGQTCVLVVAGGGGGGGTGSDTLSCQSPGWTGGSGGIMPTSSADKYEKGTLLPGGNDGAGDFGGGSGSGNGEFSSPSEGYAGSGGGGGGWPSGGGADGWWMNASKCGGGGGDSWYSGLTQLVGAVPNTCVVGGKVSTDCPGFLRMTSVPGPKATRLATRPAVPDDTVW